MFVFCLLYHKQLSPRNNPILWHVPQLMFITSLVFIYLISVEERLIKAYLHLHGTFYLRIFMKYDYENWVDKNETGKRKEKCLRKLLKLRFISGNFSHRETIFCNKTTSLNYRLWMMDLRNIKSTFKNNFVLGRLTCSFSVMQES